MAAELSSTSINLDAYFKRIHYSGDRTPNLTTLQAIHLCHPKAIAFENLNPLLKQPVRLDLPSLQTKLIDQARGGYCFEHNLLLRSVLVELGFQVTCLAARVVWNFPAGTINPQTHMLLRVDVGDQAYVVDVGFGGLTLTAPLALIPDLEQSTPHGPFRLLYTNHTYTLQAKLQSEWSSLYQFDLQERYLPDYEVSNWYVSTHPNSLFVNSLLLARPETHCRYALRDNKFTIHSLNGNTKHHVVNSVEELQNILEHYFLLKLPAIAELTSVLERFI